MPTGKRQEEADFTGKFASKILKDTFQRTSFIALKTREALIKKKKPKFWVALGPASCSYESKTN